MGGNTHRVLGAVLTGSSGAVGTWRKSQAHSPDLGNQSRLLGGGDILAETQRMRRYSAQKREGVKVWSSERGSET